MCYHRSFIKIGTAFCVLESVDDRKWGSVRGSMRGTPGCQQWKLSIRISGLTRGVARILRVSRIEIIFDGD